MKEGQQVSSAKDSRQRTVEQCTQFADSSAGQPIDIRDELDLILHVEIFLNSEFVGRFTGFAQICQ
jgi:hypothetical protein